MLSLATSAIAASFAALSAYLFIDLCQNNECCKEPWVTTLEAENAHSYMDFGPLFGQPLAVKTLKSITLQRLRYNNKNRPLVLSFHGPTGVGKTFLAFMIAKTLFKKGEESKFVHFFNCGLQFPNPGRVFEYCETLRDKISSSLQKCEKCLFIFDEFHQVPKEMLKTLVPFLDTAGHMSGLKTRKAMFIFLSDTGSKSIQNKSFKLWNAGFDRNMVTLRDFENDIKHTLPTEESFWKENVILEKDLIDAYIPFLPLEKHHIKDCILAEFLRNNATKPSHEIVESLIEPIEFLEEYNGLYARTGCRKVEYLVQQYLASGEV